MSKLPPEPPSSEITPEDVYYNRRSFMRNSALTVGTGAAVGTGLIWLIGQAPLPDQPEQAALAAPVLPPSDSKFATDETPTTYQGITTYNNYYEFGLDKPDPARNANTLNTRPWTIQVEGEVANPQTIDIDTLLGWFPL